MFTIIGGVYRENCLDPAFDQTLGSGGRAAIALSQLLCDNSDVALYTAASEGETTGLASVLQGLGIKLHITDRKHRIEFQYNHSADKAVVFPDFRDIVKIDRLNVPAELDCVLLFSLIELDQLPSFSAKRVVYDPQAGRHAAAFRSPSRSAKELAVVCNLSEAAALANLETSDAQPPSPLILARHILKHEAADVVIVKNGPFGAIAVTAERHAIIPSYKTDRVFGIGTGDVYSAVFAALWAAKNLDPIEAAQQASVATAHICSHGVAGAALPIVPADIGSLQADLVPANLDRVQEDGCVTPVEEKHVYLAGPFFSMGQVWLINELKRALGDMGLKVWSPMAEVGILPADAPVDEVRTVVAADVSAIEAASLVFAVVDGLDPGTLFEIGFAASRGIPVIALSQQPATGDLTMLRGTASCRIFDDVATSLYTAAWVGHGL